MTRRRWSGDARRGIAATALAVVVVAVTRLYGGLGAGAEPWRKVVTVGGTLLFLATFAVAIRALGALVVRHTEGRIGISHAGIARLGISLVGALFALFTALGMLGVGIGQLLVGGALTGVVVGIACQQALGNLFAGLVLLVSRPFTIGDTVVVHSGALGGPHSGMVLEMGLVYVVLSTDDGALRLPNSAVLSSGVGPKPVDPPADGDPPPVEGPNAA
jgi:small conductance mechanosensitive channel